MSRSVRSSNRCGVSRIAGRSQVLSQQARQIPHPRVAGNGLHGRDRLTARCLSVATFDQENNKVHPQWNVAGKRIHCLLVCRPRSMRVSTTFPCQRGIEKWTRIVGAEPPRESECCKSSVEFVAFQSAEPFVDEEFLRSSWTRGGCENFPRSKELFEVSPGRRVVGCSLQCCPVRPFRCLQVPEVFVGSAHVNQSLYVVGPNRKHFFEGFNRLAVSSLGSERYSSLEIRWLVRLRRGAQAKDEEQTPKTTDDAEMLHNI